MDGFNLYREAKDHYDKLIPGKKDGLILLSLYSKYKEKSFSEDDIIYFINRIYKDYSNDSNRENFERNNNIILRFQEAFLWRDKVSKTYHFKKYALDFCHNIENRLEENYNPAKIKRWFDELYNSLILNVEKNQDFNLWIEDHFDIRKPSLATQIEILDQQVNKSVFDFKTNIKSDSKDILEILKQIEFSLGIIKEQALELRNAFQISYDIDDKLTSILENKDSLNYLSNIKKVQEFHDKSRGHLEQVSGRIEKIKPRVREFIYNFNKKDFDRKTDKFINFLLQESTVKKFSGSKEIAFPLNIFIPIFKDEKIIPKLTIVPLREFSPKLPIKVPERNINKKDRKALLEKTLKWKYEKDRINYWAKLAFLNIDVEQSFEFSPFFFNVVKVDGFNIAVKFAHKVLRESTKKYEKYKVSINKEVYKNPIKSNISIWQMQIQKK